MPKSASNKWIAIAGIVGFVLLVVGMGATAWFLNSSLSQDQVAPSDSEASGDDTGQNKPICSGLSLSSSKVTSLDQSITISSSGSDPDGTPSDISIFAAVNGQNNTSTTDGQCTKASSYYCTDVTGAWVKIAGNPGTSVSVTTTFAEIESKLKALASSTGYTYVGDIKDKGILLVTNVTGQGSTDMCTSNIAYFNGSGAYYGSDATQFTQTCQGGCFQRLIYEAPVAPKDLACTESCSATSECESGLECISGSCRNPACGSDSDCVCPVTDLQCDSSCSADSECSGNLICSSGKCRDPQCTSSNSCICETGSANYSLESSMVGIASGTCSILNGISVSESNYTVMVRNSGDVAGDLKSLDVVLDSRINTAWIPVESISDGGEYVNGSIVWTMNTSLAPGQQIARTFRVNFPTTNLGEYTNTIRAYDGLQQGDSGVQPVATLQDTETISCTPIGTQPPVNVPVAGKDGLPDTAIFDTTQSKMIGAGFLIVLSAVLVGLESTDRGIVRFFTGSGSFVKNIQVKYSKDERSKRTIEKTRKDFESDWEE